MCRPEPEPGFTRALTSISPRLRLVWNPRLAQYAVVENHHWIPLHVRRECRSYGGDMSFGHFHPRDLDGDLLRHIRMNNHWNEDTSRMLRQREEAAVEARIESSARSNADLARQMASDIGRASLPKVGLNAPRIGEHPLAGFVEEMSRADDSAAC